MRMTLLVALTLIVATSVFAQTPPEPDVPPPPPPPTFAVVAPTAKPDALTNNGKPELAKMIEVWGETCVDITDDVRRGKLDFKGARVLVVGSGALTKAGARFEKVLTEGRAVLANFVTDGGLLVVFTAPAEVDKVPFLPDGLSAGFADIHVENFVAVGPEAILSGPIGAEPGLIYPGGCFDKYEGLVPQLGYDRRGRYPIILERSLGKGRILLIHMAPGPAHASGNQRDRNLANVLIGGVVAWFREAAKGDRPDAIPKTRVLAGIVYRDDNANGRRDAGEAPVAGLKIVGTDIVTDADGRYAIRLDPYRLEVTFDADLAEFRLPFWRAVPEIDERLDVGLVPRVTPLGEVVRFAHVADTGGRPADADPGWDFMRRALERVQPKVDFVVVTSDAASAEGPPLNGDFEIIRQMEYHATGLAHVMECDVFRKYCGPELSQVNLRGRAIPVDAATVFDLLGWGRRPAGFRKANIVSPPTFALIDLHPDGRIIHASRIAGIGTLCQPVYPASESSVSKGPLRMLLAAADDRFGTELPVALAMAHVRRNAYQLELVPLAPRVRVTQVGTLTKQITLDEPAALESGFYVLKMTVGPADKPVALPVISVAVADKPLSDVAFERPWTDVGGSSMHIGEAGTLAPPLVLKNVVNVGGRVLAGGVAISKGTVFVQREWQTPPPKMSDIVTLPASFCLDGGDRYIYAGDHVLLQKPDGAFRFDFAGVRPRGSVHLAVGGDFLCVIDDAGAAWAFKKTVGAPVIDAKHDAQVARDALRWHKAIAPGTRQAVATDLALFTGNACHDIATGMLQWRLDGPPLRQARVALAGKHLIVTGFVEGEGFEQVVLSVKPDSGKIAWQVKLGATVPDVDAAVGAPPTVADGMVLAPSAGGVLHAFDLDDGHALWSFGTGPSVLPKHAGANAHAPGISSEAIVSGRWVYFAAHDGVLYCLDRKDAIPKVRWKWSLGLPVIASPAISGNALVIADCDGNVFTFVSGGK